MFRRASSKSRSARRRPIREIVMSVADVDNIVWAATYIGECRYVGRCRPNFPDGNLAPVAVMSAPARHDLHGVDVQRGRHLGGDGQRIEPWNSSKPIRSKQ